MTKYLIDFTKLQSRPLSSHEVEQVTASEATLQVVKWYKAQMWILDNDPDLPVDPDAPKDEKGQPKNGYRRPKPGEGIEIGPFEFENDAKNFNSSYTGKVADALGWGLIGEDGKKTFRSRPRIKNRDGKFWLWVVRKS